MQTKSLKRFVLLATAGLLGGWLLSGSGQAAVIDAGWDLLTTSRATLVYGGTSLYFQGYGLGTYDFDGAGPNLPVSVGSIDTIMQRTGGPATPVPPGTPVPPPVPPGVTSFDLQLQALSLQGIAGTASENLYVTGVGEAGGWLTLFDNGSFQNVFKVDWTLHWGAIDGPLVPDGLGGYVHGVKTFTGTGGWNQTPTGPLIDGINYKLNGLNTANDFGVLYGAHDAGDGSIHIVDVPEPSQVVGSLMFLLVGGLASFKAYRKHSSAKK